MNPGALRDPRVRTHRLTGDRARDAAGIGPVDVALDALGATPTADATMAAYDSLMNDVRLVLQIYFYKGIRF